MKNIEQHPIIKGKTIDEQTRCVHYNSDLDIITIKFKCCQTYYPCYYCHQEDTNHPASVWSKSEFNSKAILCGNCKTELTITEYFNSNNCCPKCKEAFNPRCANHHHFYFEV